MLSTPSAFSILAMILMLLQRCFVVQQLADLQHVVSGADKGGGDEVEPGADAELDVVGVLFGHIGHAQADAGEVDALVVAHRAVVLHGAGDVGGVGGEDPQLHLAVVDEDGVARLHIPRQPLVV